MLGHGDTKAQRPNESRHVSGLIREPCRFIGIVDTKFGIAFSQLILRNWCEIRFDQLLGLAAVSLFDEDTNLVEIARGWPGCGDHIPLKRAIDAIVPEHF